MTSCPHDFLAVNQLGPTQGGGKELAARTLQWQNF